MDLIFLRHGKTDWNNDGRLQGRTDVPLNKEGIAGAKAAGEILKNEKFDAVYCSPLLRTRQTLQYAYPYTPPILDNRLLEWCFGSFEGKKMPRDFFVHWWTFGQTRVEGVELIEDVVARATDFYREVKEKYPNGRVLVVSHGGFSASLHGAIYGVKDGESLSQYLLPNSTPVLFREGQPPVMLGGENV